MVRLKNHHQVVQSIVIRNQDILQNPVITVQREPIQRVHTLVKHQVPDQVNQIHKQKRIVNLVQAAIIQNQRVLIKVTASLDRVVPVKEVRLVAQDQEAITLRQKVVLPIAGLPDRVLRVLPAPVTEVVVQAQDPQDLFPDQVAVHHIRAVAPPDQVVHQAEEDINQ